MNTRKLKPLTILCLTILVANLLSEFLSKLADKYIKTSNPYKSVAISMLVAVCVFYPAFQLMDGLVKSMTKSYVGKSKEVAGGGVYGLLISFVIALFVLYCLFLKVRYNIRLFPKFF